MFENRLNKFLVISFLVLIIGLPLGIGIGANITKSNNECIESYKQTIKELRYENDSLRKIIDNVELSLEIIEEISTWMDSKTKKHSLCPATIFQLSVKHDVDVRLLLSQGWVESHFGTAGIAARTNSVFNVGAFDGFAYSEICKTYKYSHPNESIEPYLWLIRNEYLGSEKNEQHLLRNFVNLSGSRYATYPNYERNIGNVWREIDNTTKLDSLLMMHADLKHQQLSIQIDSPHSI